MLPIPEDLNNKYEFHNYGHALEILSDAFPTEWEEIQDCLRKLKISVDDLKKPVEMKVRYQRNSMMYCTHMVGEKFVLRAIFL